MLRWVVDTAELRVVRLQALRGNPLALRTTVLFAAAEQVSRLSGRIQSSI